MIRDAEIEDAPLIASIYNYYIKNSIFTFDENPIPKSVIEEKINSSPYPFLIYEDENTILGYAYASLWKSRCAYKFSVEISIYLNPKSKGIGIGTKLYTNLIDFLKKEKIHSIIAGISLPNDASVKFHEKMGFEKVGQFKEVGFKFGKWIDVGYWERIL